MQRLWYQRTICDKKEFNHYYDDDVLTIMVTVMKGKLVCVWERERGLLIRIVFAVRIQQQQEVTFFDWKRVDSSGSKSRSKHKHDFRLKCVIRITSKNYLLLLQGACFGCFVYIQKSREKLSKWSLTNSFSIRIRRRHCLITYEWWLSITCSSLTRERERERVSPMTQ